MFNLVRTFIASLIVLKQYITIVPFYDGVSISTYF